MTENLEDSVGKIGSPIINREWCKGCGICVAFCPKMALSLLPEGKAVLERPDDCVGCRACAMRCPDLAIDSREEETTGQGAAHE